MLKSLLSARPLATDLGLLLLRLTVGLSMLTHGWPKFSGYSEKLNAFADPYGLGSPVSLTLAVFAEFFCSLFLIAGLFSRLAVIPLAITMFTAFFVIHGADPYGKKELALIYLAVYVVLFFTGPGRYSADAALRKA